MKKTPSALKWLAEKRARLAHDLAHTRQIALDVNRRLATLEVDLAALDRALVIYDPDINPERIEPVNAHRAYGKRGAFRDCIVDVLQKHSPEWVATENVETLVCIELGMKFETAALRKRWYDNSLRAQLKRLVTEGMVERRHVPTQFTSEAGHWRWRVGGDMTLAELREDSGS